jgi:hypothetical protein
MPFNRTFLIIFFSLRYSYRQRLSEEGTTATIQAGSAVRLHAAAVWRWVFTNHNLQLVELPDANLSYNNNNKNSSALLLLPSTHTLAQIYVGDSPTGVFVSPLRPLWRCVCSYAYTYAARALFASSTVAHEC